MAAPLLETPSRVLRRVMEAEDVELPSLPSIIDHLDQTSDDGMYSPDDSDAHSRSAPAKPSPFVNRRRGSQIPNTPLSDITTSSMNNSGPLFPPPNASKSKSSSPYASTSTKATTSTPVTVRSSWTHRSETSPPSTIRQEPRLGAHTRTTSNNMRSPGARDETMDSTSTGGPVTYAPEEMSLSFDGLPIQDDLSGLSLHDSGAPEGRSLEPVSEDDASQSHLTGHARGDSDSTPETQSPNVLLTRSHRRAPSRYDGISSGLTQSLPRTPSATDRIPSLSRSSDGSATDSSAAANTPENIHRSTFASPIIGTLDPSQETESSEILDMTENHTDSHFVDSTSFSASKTPSRPRMLPRSASSPVLDFPPPPVVFSTTQRNAPSTIVPTTPTSEGRPSALNAHGDDTAMQTPRVATSGPEWRKNHVLAVLQSTVKPRARGISTPYASTRLAALHGEVTPSLNVGRKLPSDSVSQTFSLTPSNNSFEMAGDGSFVSVASSADLTSDRRASTAAHGPSNRGNTSFPNILLATGTSNSMHALEHRVDGAKLQKHLNAMNKQLLDENRELAIALESWQNEAEHLRLRLRESRDHDDNVDLPSLKRPSADLPSAAPDSFQSVSDDAPVGLQQVRSDELEISDRRVDAKQREISEPRSLMSEGDGKDDVASLKKELNQALALSEHLRTEFALKTEEHATRFGDICSEYQATINSLNSQLACHEHSVKASNPESEREMTTGHDLHDIELRRAEERQARPEIESRLQLAENNAKRLEAELATANDLLQVAAAAENQLRQQLAQAQSARDEAQREVSGAQIASEGFRHSMQGALEKLAAMEQARIESHRNADNLNRHLETALQDVDRLRILEQDQERQITDLEEALDEAERQMAADEILVADLRKQFMNSSRSPASPSDTGHHASAALLQEELDAVHRELGRVRQQLQDETGAAQAERRRLELIIKSLQKENEGLSKNPVAATSGRVTPSGLPDIGLTIAASPFGPLHRAVTSLRTPGPLGELSWMNATSGDSETALHAHVENLQAELAAANNQLDGNFSRLEAAGASAVELADRLAKAEGRVRELERELAGSGEQHIIARSNPDSTIAKRLAELQVDMKDERSRLQAESSRLRSTIDMLQAEHAIDCERLRAELKVAHRELRAAKRTHAGTADARNQQAETNLVKSKARERRLQAELAAATRRLSVLQDELHSLKAQLSGPDYAQLVGDLQSTIALERKRAHQFSQHLIVASDALRSQEDRVAQLEREKVATTQDLAAFEQDLNHYRKMTAQFSEELRQLQLDHTLKPHSSRSSVDTQGLVGQIRYLKAKFTREASHRNALCLQKRYLLLLVGGMSLNEQATLKAIASMGFPSPAPEPRKRTFRSIVLACIAISRARAGAANWRAELSVKAEILASHERMRLARMSRV